MLVPRKVSLDNKTRDRQGADVEPSLLRRAAVVTLTSSLTDTESSQICRFTRPATARTLRGEASQIAPAETVLQPMAIQKARA